LLVLKKIFPEHCEVGFHSLAELGQVLKHLGNAGTPVNMLSLMYVEINEDLANFFEAHQQCWKKGIGAVVVSHCSCFDAKHFLDFFSGIFQPASVFFASIDGFTVSHFKLPIVFMR
jgi:hypothetical protein